MLVPELNGVLRRFQDEFGEPEVVLVGGLPVRDHPL